MAAQKLFWGLHIECGKGYAQTVNQGFAVKQAVLEKLDSSPSKNPRDGPVHVFAKYDNLDFLLCILSTKQVETSQAQLNVKFETGAQITLRVEGPPNHQVHLTGYCIPSPKLTSTPNTSTITIPFEGQQKSILVSSKRSIAGGDAEEKPKKRVSIEDIVSVSTVPSSGNKSVGFKGNSDEDDDEEEEDDDDDMNFIKNGLKGLGGDDEDDDEDDDSDDDEELEDEDDRQAYLKMLREKVGLGKKKSKPLEEQDTEELEVDDDEDDDDDDDEDDDEDDDDEEDSDEDLGVAAESLARDNKASTPKSSKIPVKNGLNESGESNKGESKKAAKKSPSEAEPKTPENQKIQALKAPSSAGHTPMKTITKGGVMIQELKVGNGPIAKGGKMVTVYYQGRLKQNNKMFDQSSSGPGFKFRLGKGEVIKGWDIGVEGMKVGGKRKIIIPANLGYGKRGAPPDIPPNSTLAFDIELKNVH